MKLLQVLLDDSATYFLAACGEKHAVAKWTREGKALGVFLKSYIDRAVIYVY